MAPTHALSTLPNTCQLPGTRTKETIKVVYDNTLEPLDISDVLTTNYNNMIEMYCEDAGITLANELEPLFHGYQRK